MRIIARAIFMPLEASIYRSCRAAVMMLHKKELFLHGLSGVLGSIFYRKFSLRFYRVFT